MFVCLGSTPPFCRTAATSKLNPSLRCARQCVSSPRYKASHPRHQVVGIHRGTHLVDHHGSGANSSGQQQNCKWSCHVSRTDVHCKSNAHAATGARRSGRRHTPVATTITHAAGIDRHERPWTWARCGSLHIGNHLQQSIARNCCGNTTIQHRRQRRRHRRGRQQWAVATIPPLLQHEPRRKLHKCGPPTWATQWQCRVHAQGTIWRNSA